MGFDMGGYLSQETINNNYSDMNGILVRQNVLDNILFHAEFWRPNVRDKYRDYAQSLDANAIASTLSGNPQIVESAPLEIANGLTSLYLNGSSYLRFPAVNPSNSNPCNLPLGTPFRIIMAINPSQYPTSGSALYASIVQFWNGNGWRILLSGAGGVFMASSASGNPSTSKYPIPLNKWSIVELSRQSDNTWRSFVNGRVDSEGVATSFSPNNSNGMTIGTTIDSPSNWLWFGRIAYVLISATEPPKSDYPVRLPYLFDKKYERFI